VEGGREGGREGVIYAFLHLIFVEYFEEGEEVEGFAELVPVEGGVVHYFERSEMREEGAEFSSSVDRVISSR